MLLDDTYLCLSDWTDAILFQTIYYFGAKKRGNNQVVETLQKRFLDRKSTLLTRWHCTANAYARSLHSYNSFKKIYKFAFEFGFLVYSFFLSFPLNNLLEKNDFLVSLKVPYVTWKIISKFYTFLSLYFYKKLNKAVVTICFLPCWQSSGILIENIRMPNFSITSTSE